MDPFGCAKNQVDAETMMALLAAAGWSAAENPADADLIIVNSCGFIESAKRESINAVLSWRKNYPEKKILLAGCLAQRYAGELARAMPEADGFFGNADLGGVAAAAMSVLSSKKDPPPSRPSRPREPRLPPPAGGRTPPLPSGEPPAPENYPKGNYAPGERPLLSLPGAAYVKISEGCNNRCSFCSIPLIRGPLKSRSIPDISAECRSLLGRGIRELNVIGQDIASFGKDRPGEGDLPALLEAIAALPGNFWVRLLYLHPDHIPLSILDIMRGDSRFLPYFDIPIQHASGPLLRAMNRRGDGERYLDLIARIRSALPAAVIRSTFLTGFPGETEEDFGLLLDFQRRAALDWMGCFTYSREEHTPAYSMGKRVSRRTAAGRKRILEERQQGISEGRMERFLGGELDILVEEQFETPGEDLLPPEGTGLYLGRAYCQAPEVDGAVIISSGRPLNPGSLVRCGITGRAGIDLEARILSN
ncbi:MAG: 30S ribosomal protein S12 methylthiotransferase RimO [Treponema sp.]|nr:30S ribosomal protein S12 methylthiotransferase RimO [Treponema sp.]